MTTATAPVVASRGLAARALQRGVRALGWIGPLVVLALVWEGLARSEIISARLLPPFSDVFAEAVTLVAEGDILPHLGTSLYRAMIGLALGAGSGIVLGIGMAMAPLAQRTLYPLLTLTYTLPKSALIPIAFLWLGVGDASVILVVFLATLVPLIINAYHGAESVPSQYVWSARSMGTGRTRLLLSVIAPAALPNIMNGLRISLALSMVVTISAEMVAAFVGIGQFIFRFGESGAYTHMFSAILIAVTAVFAIDRVFTRVAGFVLRWTEGEQLGV